MRRSIRGAAWLLTVLFSIGFLGCGTISSYRLPLSGHQASATFSPLAACASAQSLTAIEHSTSVNVRYDGNTWIQFMIQGDQYNMVIIVSNDVPPDQRAARTSSAKAKGDELWACAMSHGIPLAVAIPMLMSQPVAPAPPAAMAEPMSPTPPSAPTAINAPAAPVAPIKAACRNPRELAPRSICASAKGPACTTDSQCQSNSCSRGFCQNREPGSPCKENANCNSNNCTGGCCHARDPGAHCSEDMQCNSNNCTNGMCQDRMPGSPCKENSGCNTNNCTGGCCQ